MSFLQKLKTGGDDVTGAKDSLGGGGFVVDSAIYPGDIKVAYLITSPKGAHGVELEVALGNGSMYRETLYVSNRNGETFYEKNGAKFVMPSYALMDAICMLTTEKEFLEQETVDKVLNVWDSEAQKKIPREVPVLVDLIDQKIALGILKKRENKTQYNESTGKYEPINEERMLNNINAVFHPELRVTLNEALEGRDPEFWDKWMDHNDGRLVDTFKEVSSTGGGRSRSASTRASSDGAEKTAAPRKSIFADKK